MQRKERNENNPIWKNYLELEKIFQECTLVDKFKLGDALKSCDQLKDVLDPEIDLYYGNFIIASKGKKMMNGFPQVKTQFYLIILFIICEIQGIFVYFPRRQKITQ